MNEQSEQLEGRLRQLRPRSTSVGFVERVTAQLDATAEPSRRVHRWIWRGAAALAAAACLLGAIFWLIPADAPRSLLHAYWQLTPTEGAEHTVLGPTHIQLDRGEVRLTSTSVRRPDTSLTIDTPAGTATATGTDFYIGTDPLISGGTGMKYLTRILILSGTVGLAGPQGTASGEANDVLVAVEQTAPVKLDTGGEAEAARELYKQLGTASAGKVADVHGVVLVKPMMGRRWTPVQSDGPVVAGDWIKADPRGGNAAQIHLRGGGKVIVGPGSLIEIATDRRVRLIRGDMQVVADDDAALEIVGPDQAKPLMVGATTTLRRADGKGEPLETLDHEPPWLRYFKGTLTTESLGSLVAMVDGRNVPLTVGYHKVTVDIRDQIARTVIEESFVNHTAGRLEGVFHFPLPADASISGFGMWIGDTLVEADVVEKQRAREIYETILRENRDPGLLEWSGGNIFKARVFPILPHSEKRIKLTYTQVLPRQGNSYRYSYALQSEMLRQHPLRALSIDVRVHSAVPLTDIASATHDCRIDRTPHAAHVEFAANEYTPQSDFEVEVQLDAKAAPLTLLPHRRGEDGYFLLSLTPPGEDGAWQRDLVPDGKPVTLLILADTSGSMDLTQSRNRDAFIAHLLGSLGEGDRFNIAVCDVNTEWLFDEPVACTQQNVQQACERLAARISLGWTDLDAAFADALNRADEGTQVIYVGDGVVTAGDGDAVAFAQRLRQMAPTTSKITAHAVATGSSYESAVLTSIASIGGGSVHRIDGTDTPAQVALDLLREIASPALRDVRVRFEGFRAARVFPAKLPNVPVGRQQIVLGRYLPEDRDLVGQVIVEGVRDGKPVRFRSEVSFEDDEKGNSFIPRLWARRYLDHLLEQGRSPVVRNDVIAMSERYQIMTPYTSFLVLETDADRERFKVTRRFRMRDGEKFFAEGRDEANLALLQQQMERAGLWRQGLRRSVLRDIDGMRRYLDFGDGVPGGRLRFSGMVGGGGTRGGWRGQLGYGNRRSLDVSGPMDSEHGWEYEGMTGAEYKLEVSSPFGDVLADEELSDLAEAPSATASPAMARENRTHVLELGFDRDSRIESDALRASAPMSKTDAYTSLRRSGSIHRKPYPGRSRAPRPLANTDWPLSLFPTVLPAPELDPTTRRWPDEASEIAARLLHREELAGMDGGLVFDRTTRHLDAHRGDVTHVAEDMHMVSLPSWLKHQGGGQQGQFIVHWRDGEYRAAWSPSLGLARRHPVGEADVRYAPLPINEYFMTSIERTFGAWEPTVEPRDEDRVLLTCVQGSKVRRFLIDTARRVILQEQRLSNGKLTAKVHYGGFQEHAGCWWATSAITTDAEGRRTRELNVAITPLDADAFAKRLDVEKAGLDKAIMLQEPMPDVAAAKQAVADATATIEHRLILLAYYAGTQRWDLADAQLKAAELPAGERSGPVWIRDAFLRMSRRRAELNDRLLQRATQIVGGSYVDQLFLADHVFSQGSVLQANEQLALLDVLKPAYDRAPISELAQKQWTQHRVRLLERAGQPGEAADLQRQLAERYPNDSNIQTYYARLLHKAGRYDAARAWVLKTLEEGSPWPEHYEGQLRSVYMDLLEDGGRFKESATYAAAWIADDPTNQDPYGRYLSALVRSGQEETAAKEMLQWISQGIAAADQTDKEDIKPALARLQAAVSQAMGRGHGWYANYIEQRWHEPLAQTVRAYARSVKHAGQAQSIMGDHRFRRTDACADLRRHYTERLLEQIDMADGGEPAPDGAAQHVGRLTAGEISRFVSWVWDTPPTIEAKTWERMADAIRSRWDTEEDADIQHQLAQPLVRILNGRLQPAQRLAFLATQYQTGPEAHRRQYARQYFDALLAQPWQQAFEDEALELLRVALARGPIPQHADDQVVEADRRLSLQVQALYELTDRMIAARSQALMDAVGHQERLSRTELRAMRREHLAKARTGLAARWAREVRSIRELRAADAEAGKAIDSRLSAWIDVERLWLETQLDEDAKRIAIDVWEAMLPEPPSGLEPVKPLDGLLLQRHLGILEYLATRPSADPALADRLLAYYEKGRAGDPENHYWQHSIWSVLVALDRAQPLERALRSWIDPDRVDTIWRIALGYLLGETGRLDEAIEQFEAVERADELGPTEYRQRAGWYLVEDEQRKHTEALIKALTAMDEWRLQQRLEQMLRPWARDDGEVPEALDPEAIRVFTALFRKASRPGDHVYQLDQFYRYTHDFRLLRCMADSVIGHSPQTVYPFLRRMQSVLGRIRDEATADQLVEQIAEVRAAARTRVDHRALDMLTAQVERRSAEVIDQPGPHVNLALTAMQSAFKGDWEPGERRLMAELLADLGRITQAPLAAEQRQQLAMLHRDERPGTIDRLSIAHALARTLWHYGTRDAAIDGLEAALAEFRAASGGTIPPSANSAFESLVGYLESLQRYRRAEAIVQEELTRPANTGQARWLTERLYRVYGQAVTHSGTTSFGDGPATYKPSNRGSLRRHWRRPTPTIVVNSSGSCVVSTTRRTTGRSPKLTTTYATLPRTEFLNSCCARRTAIKTSSATSPRLCGVILAHVRRWYF